MRFKKLKNTLIYLVARVFLGWIRWMGFERSLRFGHFLGRVAYRLAGKVRRDTLTHLKIAFPNLPRTEREKIAQLSFEHFGTALAECINIHRLPDFQAFMSLDAQARQLLDRLFSGGKGVVLVTGHCGNWELMARAIVTAGYSLHAIGKKSYDPRFTNLMQRFRGEGGVHTIWRGDEHVVEKMMEALKHNAILGLLIDQDTKVPGTFVPFFGRLAYTPTIAAVIARKTGSPIITAFNHRKTTGGYEIRVEEFVPSAHADFRQAVAADTAALTALIQKHIEKHPNEWVWMHRRWKTRPTPPGLPQDPGLQGQESGAMMVSRTGQEAE
jgi:Kdo2-lipid IVA lauroyltransferase/acyltransferase